MSFRFDYGAEVTVKVSAPAEFRPGESAAVCGMRELGGNAVYTIEFGDGSDCEIPEYLLEALESK